LIFTSGTFVSGSNTAKIVFNGLTTQSITGDFTTANAAGFYNLAVDNPAGILLNNDIDIVKQLTLTNGIIEPAGNKLFMPTGGVVFPPTGGVTSYVNGRFTKELLPGESFTFPIGKGGRWRPAAVNAVSGGTYEWVAEYFVDSPKAPPYNATSSDPAIVSISNGEYWKITDGATGGSARVGLSWGSESGAGDQPAERETLRVLKWNTTTITWDNFGGTNFSSGHTQNRGSFVSTNPVSFSEQTFTLGSVDLANALPVELVNFTARKSGSTVILNWQTASELENDYFEVEVSSTGENFNGIARIDGNGNSNKLIEYEYVDQNPLLGQNYYRLKQVDFDGDVEYSKVIGIFNDAPSTLRLNLYPQPASNEVTFQFNGVNTERSLDLTIYNMSGQLVKNLTLNPKSKELSLDVSLLSSGLYIVRLSQSHSYSQQKLIIKK
jgi:hypothetical protein